MRDDFGIVEDTWYFIATLIYGSNDFSIPMLGEDAF